MIDILQENDAILLEGVIRRAIDGIEEAYLQEGNHQEEARHPEHLSLKDQGLDLQRNHIATGNLLNVTGIRDLVLVLLHRWRG